MQINVKCLNRHHHFDFQGEYVNELDALNFVSNIIKTNLIPIQLKGIIQIKLNVKYSLYEHNDNVNIFCNVHSITYKVGTDYESTMDIVEQDYDTLITNLRWIISKIKNEFYKQQILKETNKINLFRSV